MENTLLPTAVSKENIGLSITVKTGQMPEQSRNNLLQLIDAKSSLLSVVTDSADLDITFDDDSVTFPWFSAYDTPEEIHAYCSLVSALCRMAGELSRTTCKEKPVQNQKYAFRCFLLRLGFIGDEYKADRHELLKNLDGSSAFKDKGTSQIVSKEPDYRVLALAKAMSEIEDMRKEVSL